MSVLNSSIPRPLPPTDFDRRAVPSPFRALCGMRIMEWEKDRCVIEIAIRPEFRNFSGVLAGPIIGAAVDAGGTLAGCYVDEPGAVIKAISLSFSVTFVGTATEGTIRAVCVKKGGGRKIFNSTVEVFDHKGTLIATGQGIFRYISD